MEKVEVTRRMIGFCHMQVCAETGATDEEILEVCNSENPSGTSNGWGTVVREDEDWCGTTVKGPVKCEDHDGREHILVAC